jgi:hypothetical protein
VKRENGNSSCAGSSHAIDFTEATTLGGKADWPSASRPFLERFEALFVKPLAHATYKRTTRIKAIGNHYVVESFRRIKNDTRADHSSKGSIL